MKIFDNRRPVIFTAVTFLLAAAPWLLLGFGIRPPGSSERIADCVVAGVFLSAIALLFRRRRWVRVYCSVLLALVLINFAFVSFAPARLPPEYSSYMWQIPYLRAGAIVITALLAWLFLAFAFGRGTREYFAKREAPKVDL